MMANLLDPAALADETRSRGVVAATSMASAQPDEGRRALALLKVELVRVPTLAAVLAAQARRQRLWLVAALPLALTVLNFRHLQRLHRLLQAHALGDWDRVRVLAQALRPYSAARPQLDFDLDLRLAGIYARDHDLAAALQRLAPWRARWQRQPGSFEQGVATVHLVAGDNAGFVDLMARAHDLKPDDAWRRLDHALAEARFGRVDKAAALLDGMPPARVPDEYQAFRLWARGLLQLRAAQPEAEATLGQAVAAFAPLTGDPAAWTALALCACDHAIALQRAGRSAVARQRIAEVWPILEWHAPIPLLRMLEADGLLPERAHKNT